MHNILIIWGIVLAICLISLIISRHVGRDIIAIYLIVVEIVTLYLLMPRDKILVNILLFIVLIAINVFYFFIQFKIKYDFMNKIYTLNYFINSTILKPKVGIEGSDKVLIGKVIPYNNFQLKYNGKFITMNDVSSAGASLISGSSGSGKTWELKSIIKQNIANGKSVIFCDYKGDPKVLKELIEFTKQYNYDIYNLSNGLADFNYDPLQNLNNVGRIEAIMNMRKWDISGADGHYKTGTQLLLQKTIGDFSHYYRESTHGVNGSKSYTYEYYRYMKRYSYAREEYDAYNTINKLLELLITSSLEPMFKEENDKTLNFKEIKNKKFLIIASFVSSNKELATSFSSLLFRDILDECTVDTPTKNILLCIDEFATLENPFIIKDVLEKGRSGKIATYLALQDLNQIVIQTNEAYLKSILGTINTFIIFAGGTRDTAEKFAGVQLHEIEPIIMNLRKPINGKNPTAIYISKYPSLNTKTTSEVYRFEPYIFKGNENSTIELNNENSISDDLAENNSKFNQQPERNIDDLIAEDQRIIEENRKREKKLNLSYNNTINKNVNESSKNDLNKQKDNGENKNYQNKNNGTINPVEDDTIPVNFDDFI